MVPWTCPTRGSGSRGWQVMRRLSVVMIGLSLLAMSARATLAEPTVQVFKSSTCGCCSKWIDHLKAKGFAVQAEDVAAGRLSRIKSQSGIKPEHASCHTARIAGYTIEGHVPAADVRRLLSEKPDAIGLAVPGMPLGSPGMEAGDRKEPYRGLADQEGRNDRGLGEALNWASRARSRPCEHLSRPAWARAAAPCRRRSRTCASIPSGSRRCRTACPTM